ERCRIVDCGDVEVDVDLVQLVAGRERDVRLDLAALGGKLMALHGADELAAPVGHDGELGHVRPPPCRLWVPPPGPWLVMLTKYVAFLFFCSCLRCWSARYTGLAW